MSKNRLTKQDLRHDPVKEGLVQAFSAGNEFWKTNGTAVTTVVIIFVLGVLGGLWLSKTAQGRTMAANQSLAQGFEAFRAPVVTGDADNLNPDLLSFTSATAKLEGSMEKFDKTFQEFSDRRAGKIAGMMKARCLTLLDRNDEALELTDSMLSSSSGGPMEPFILQIKGEILSTQGNFDEAFEVFSSLSQNKMSTLQAVQGTLEMARTRHLQGQDQEGKDVLKAYLADLEEVEPKPYGYLQAQDMLREVFAEDLPSA